MQIGVPKETAPRERRVALAPDSVARLVKAGATVVVEHGAGESASFPDSAYATAGAMLPAAVVSIGRNFGIIDAPMSTAL